MKAKIILAILLVFILASFVSANECTNNNGICTSTCSENYLSSSFSCTSDSDSCCISKNSFTCEKGEGYICSTLNFNPGGITQYKPEDVGLIMSNFTCPYSKYCYKKNFTVYYGDGDYSLLPGDEIHFNNNYIVKYSFYYRNSTWHTANGPISGKIASVLLYKDQVDYSNLRGISAIAFADLESTNKEITKTFSNGIWLYGKPLGENSNIIKVKVSIGNLSYCEDTDAYTLGNTQLELSIGKWGRNYYKKGVITERIEDSNGKKETIKEDTCSEDKLIEYYCKDNQLNYEEKECKCLDEGACKKGFFDAISEWLGKTFGYIN